MMESIETVGQLVEVVLRDPDPDRVCAGCDGTMIVPPELEPTALCNSCAQEAALALALAIGSMPWRASAITIVNKKLRTT